MKAITLFIALIFLFNSHSNGQETNRDRNTNELKMAVEGGDQGFEDEAYIHFREGATTGYDPELEAIKWYSPDPEATMIWTVASDGTNLAINKLPLEDLHTALNQIPLQFVCGYGGGTYTLTFSQLETFDQNTEIWLADQLINGDDWIQMTEEDNTYTFSGLPDDPADRFAIYIFDPTAMLHTDGINKEESAVNIYAAGNKIYVARQASTEITDIKIFNMMGRGVGFQTTSVASALQILHISGQTGLYVVRSLTNDRVYTAKVLIVY